MRGLPWLAAGSLLTAACGFWVQVLWAALLSPELLGHMAAAWSALMLAALVAGWGVAGFWLKLFAELESHGGVCKGFVRSQWLVLSFLWVALGLCGAALAWFGWLWFSGAGAALSWPLVVLLGLSLPLQVLLELTSSRLQWCGDFLRLAVWQLLPNGLRLLWLLGLLFVGASYPMAMAWGYAGIAVVLLPLGWLWLWQAPVALKRRGLHHGLLGFRALGVFWWSALPFAGAGVVYLLYLQGGVLLVHMLVGASAAAHYQVALVVMSGMYLLPTVVVHKFLLPRLHRLAFQNVSLLGLWYLKASRWLLLTGLFVLVLLWVVVPVVLPSVFGTHYEASVSLILILALGVPWRFLSLASGAVLSTGERMALKVRLLAVAWLLQLVLALFLLPVFGATGVALALLASDVALFFLHHWAVKRVLLSNVAVPVAER